MAFLSLIVLLGTIGVAWLLLRDTPRKKIHRWRQASEFFFNEAGDISAAEELNAKILQLLPGSTYDLLFKAALNERKGTREGLLEALEVYDSILSGVDSRFVPANLFKARVLRALDRLDEARGVALSVTDALPFEAHMELGRIASMMSYSREALEHHGAALRRFARDEGERARAHAAMASVYLRELSVSIESPLNGQAAPESEAERSGLEESCRKELDLALSSLHTWMRSSRQRDEHWLWAASLHIQRSRVKTPSETPLRDGALAFDSYRDAAERTGQGLPPSFFTARGTLRAGAAWNERDRLPEDVVRELAAGAEQDFARALGFRGREDARELLDLEPFDDDTRTNIDRRKFEADPRQRDRRDYLRNLVSISETYLDSPAFDRILEDSSALELSSRIDDARASKHREISGLFSLVAGFALWKSGQPEKARGVFEEYLGSLETELRPYASVALAAKCHRYMAGSPAVFWFIDRIAGGSGVTPVTITERALDLLVELKREDQLAAEASLRIDALLEAVPAGAQTLLEHLQAARILARFRDPDQVIEFLTRTQKAFPEENAPRMLAAHWLLNSALRQDREGDEPRAHETFRRAVHAYLQILVRDPATVSDVMGPARAISRILERLQPGTPWLALPGDTFPGTPEAETLRFSTALKHYLLEEYSDFVAGSEGLASAETFQPLLSFLRGTALLELARRDAAGGSDALPKGPDHRAAAEREFRSRPNLLVNRVELANLALLGIPPEQDIGEDLLTEIRRLADRDEIRGGAVLVLWHALERRIRLRLRGPNIRFLEVERLALELQDTLRKAIQTHPGQPAAYVALANSISLLARARARETGVAGGSIPATEYRKAIHILEAAPRPNGKLVAALAVYSELADEPRAGRKYQIASNLIEPGPASMRNLVANLLRSRDLDTLEELLSGTVGQGAEARSDIADRLEAAASSLEDRRYSELLRILEPREAAADVEAVQSVALKLVRERWSAVPGFEALRQMYLAELHGARLADAITDGARLEARKQIVFHYDRAMEAFETMEARVPLNVLNNLAWYLVLESADERRARGLGLAERAVERAGSREKFPEVFDTHAWALFHNGQLRASKEAYLALLEAVEGPGYRLRLARVLTDLGELHSARAQVEMALVLPSCDRKAAVVLRNEIDGRIESSDSPVPPAKRT